jgi:hypothetical protein
VGFWEDFNLNESKILFMNIIKEKYNIEISDNPDYIICSVFGDYYDYCKYPQVRIMFSPENYIPDFNFIDYAISSYPLKLQDRHCQIPYFINYINGNSMKLESKDRNYTNDILLEKKYFANFIASHESEYGIRGDFFKKLCKYKKVESPGSYLNNIELPYKISHLDDSKIEFQKKCKFTLCFESTLNEGFITEKITDAFYADTIPVYYGSHSIKEIFNEKAFIYVPDYKSFDEVIEKIIELDNDDEKYLEMLRQPIFLDKTFVSDRVKELDDFISNIFEQPVEKAYRRSRVYTPKKHENYLLDLKNIKNRYINGTIFEELSGKGLISLFKRKIKNRITKDDKKLKD